MQKKSNPAVVCFDNSTITLVHLLPLLLSPAAAAASDAGAAVLKLLMRLLVVVCLVSLSHFPPRCPPPDRYSYHYPTMSKYSARGPCPPTMSIRDMICGLKAAVCGCGVFRCFPCSCLWVFEKGSKKGFMWGDSDGVNHVAREVLQHGFD